MPMITFTLTKEGYDFLTQWKYISSDLIGEAWKITKAHKWGIYDLNHEDDWVLSFYNKERLFKILPPEKKKEFLKKFS